MRGGASDSTNLDVIMGFDEQQLLVQLSHKNLNNRKCFILYHHSPVNANVSVLMLSTAKRSLISAHHVAPHRTCTSRPAAPRHAHALALAPAWRGEQARARVVHRPPLTGFTSGVHEVHPLSRLRSSSNPDTELSN